MLSPSTLSLRMKLVASVLLAAAIVLAGWFLRAGAPSGLAHRFVPGQRLVYELSYLTASTSNFMGLDESEDDADKHEKESNTLHTNVDGELVATVIETNKEGALVAIQLRKPSIQVASDGMLALEQGEIIAKDLERPFFAQLDRQGRIINVRFVPEAQGLSQSFAQSLLAAVQIVLPTDQAETWQAQEEDPNGKYTANYTRTSPLDRGIVTLEKRRASYVPKARRKLMQTLESETIVQPQGTVAVEFDALDGVLKALTGNERTTIVVEGRVVSRSESKLRLRLVDRSTTDKAERASLQARLDAAGPAFALSHAGDTAQREAALHRKELGDATLDSLLRELAKRQAAGDSGSDDTPLYLKLKALVYLHPEVCVQLAKELTGVSADGPAIHLLSGALSSIGHEKAQAALQSAIRARVSDWSAMMALVPALGMVENPTPATEQTLRDLAGAPDAQVRSTAQLALGIIARTLADTEPERARRILRETLKQLEEAKDDETRRQNLLVLGNIGANETLAVITANVDHPAPQVRAAAVAALRWLEAASVDDRLINALASDPDEQVRIEAAQALGLRPMTAAMLTAHKNALAKESSSTIRLTLLRNIAQVHRTFGEAREILAESARNDSVEEVRDEASRLLANLGR